MRYSKIEFWVASALFAILLTVKLNNGLSEYGYMISRDHAVPNYLFNSLLPRLAIIIACYGAFMIINFYAINHFWRQQQRLAATGIIIGVLALTGLVFTVAQSYISSWIYNQYSGFAANATLLSRGFSMAITFFMIYGGYVLLREGFLYLLRQQRQPAHSLALRVAKEVIIAVTVWVGLLIIFWGLLSPGSYGAFGPLYIVVPPFCFIIYFVNLYVLIPYYKNAQKLSGATYLIVLFLTAVAAGFLEVMFMMAFVHRFTIIAYLVFCWFIPAVLTVGLSWWVYQSNRDKYRQLALLKTALGASNANLQFLRSQINPHFLFNVLNALYGTALMENAGKTGEGIQKLGDMMRFMLHENTQDQILLSREIEYLNNYIDLQNLRVALSDNIEIKAGITDIYHTLSIAPMLLIPFIENAYKHGLSFKQRSWINISLQLRDSILQLDVYNSIHPAKENDPETQRSGIGLENVKQRLQLIYPQRHELVIRQNQTEFFIHLTLQLS